jgi:hypothetical protein
MIATKISKLSYYKSLKRKRRKLQHHYLSMRPRFVPWPHPRHNPIIIKIIALEYFSGS